MVKKPKVVVLGGHYEQRRFMVFDESGYECIHIEKLEGKSDAVRIVNALSKENLLGCIICPRHISHSLTDIALKYCRQKKVVVAYARQATNAGFREALHQLTLHQLTLHQLTLHQLTGSTTS